MSENLYSHWTAEDWQRLRAQYQRQEERRTAALLERNQQMVVQAQEREKRLAKLMAS